MKLGPKDNPHRIPLYKLHTSDGQGAWFARRSVHEGMGFSKWKAKQSSEIEETLRVNQRRMEKGKSPDYSVRGIGAEKVVEDVPVYGQDEKTVIAHVKVYHVSAVFPKPTTPRDFTPLIITCEFEGGLEGLENKDGKGRCWMVVSIPVTHEDIPARDGYIRGQYESVEFIREVPKRSDSQSSSSSSKENGEKQSENDDSSEVSSAGDSTKGRKRGKTESSGQEKEKENANDEAADEDDTNPVEWIMVTRSDPGGNIPRWMVEKGTPKSICADTVKFLNWACKDDGLQKPDGTLRDPESTDEADEDEDDDSDSEPDESDLQERHGLIASFSYLVNAGLERFAPQAVLDYMPHQIYHPSHDTPTQSGDTTPTGGEKDKKTLESESLRSPDKTSLSGSAGSEFATPPLENGNISAEVMAKDKKGKLSNHEKQLVKLAQQKHDSEVKLESVRSEMQALNLESSADVKSDKKTEGKESNPSTESIQTGTTDKDKKTEGKDSTRSSESSQRSTTTGKDKDKATESPATPSRSTSKTNVETVKTHKAASHLYNTESKLLKQIAKIEKEQLKVAGKIQSKQKKDAEKQKKDAEKEEKSKSKSEVDGLRKEVKELKKEIESFRNDREKWLGLVKSLQDENAKLIAKAGGTADEDE